MDSFSSRPLNPHASPFFKQETITVLPLDLDLPHNISTPKSLLLPHPSVLPFRSQSLMFYFPEYVSPPYTPAAWTYSVTPTFYCNISMQPSEAVLSNFCAGVVGKNLITYNSDVQPNLSFCNTSTAPQVFEEKRAGGAKKYRAFCCRDKNRNERMELAPRFRQKGKSSWVVKTQKSDRVIEHDGTKTVMKNSSDSDNFDGVPVVEGKTSLMIRNIPNQFERHDLLRILDEHCLQENRKADLRADPVRSEYDFVYLPMDFQRGANLGYAFVNFTKPVAASRFWKSFNKYEWRVSMNRKTCEICYAAFQGKDSLMNHFKNSVFPCHTNRYLPVVFESPRDGHVQSKMIHVGRKIYD